MNLSGLNQRERIKDCGTRSEMSQAIIRWGWDKDIPNPGQPTTVSAAWRHVAEPTGSAELQELGRIAAEDPRLIRAR